MEPHGAAGAVEPAEILDLLRTLARPRMAGSTGAEAVAEEIRGRFESLGYRTRSLPFSFSSLPGRYGLPWTGAVLIAMGVAGGWLVFEARPAVAFLVLVIGLVMAVLPILFLDPALRRLPWGRVETANLLFTRDVPRFIVMAHRDTKSQLVPTLVRTVVLAVALTAWGVLAALAASGLTTPAPGGPPWGGQGLWAGLGAGALAAAGVVLVLSRAGNRSPGALDNGTGLAALLALATRVDPDVGFLVTDGEELGLAGARAVVRDLPVAGVLNLDGLDDGGAIRIAGGRDAGAREAANPVTRALETAAGELGLETVVRPLPPFVMVDHEPLVAAGIPALTLLKGSWRSLLRVHRPDDTVDRLDGTGAAAVASVVARALSRAGAAEPDTLRPGDASGHSPAP